MRLATIGDIHASQSNIKDTRRGMAEVNKICDDKDVTWLIITGDVFHEFNIGGKHESSGSVLDSVNGPLNDFLAVDDKRRILMIPGNHDKPTEKDSKDALTSWDYDSRIYVSREIEAFKLTNDFYIITLPWMWSHQYAKKSHLLKRLQELRANIGDARCMLIGHCEVEGTPFPSGYTMFGGNFSFTKKEIEDLKFNIVVLGHIHKQDAWYVGSPWQHNFSEAGLMGSMRIVEAGGFEGRLKNTTYIIPNTAKYHVVDQKNMPYSVPKGDYVKVVGDKLHVVLPPGYKFEKKKENYKSVVRSIIDYGDSISDWFKKYVSDKNIKCNMKDIIDMLQDINIKGRYTHNRSLARFDYIHVKGVGPHKDTKIVFSDPIIAISGENGTGKTILMESMFALMYGHLPSYGKINDISDDVASVEGVFHTNKDKYRVLRIINGEEKKAYVWKNDEKKSFIGPKISEVKKFMEKIVGPEELLLSSVFSTQHYAGDIVDLDPGKRKDIFNKLLGLENMAEVKDVIDDRLKLATTRKDTLTSRYGMLSTVEELETSITGNIKQLQDTRLKIGRCEINRDGLKTQNEMLNNKITTLQKDLITKTNYETQLKNYEKNISDIKMCMASKLNEIDARESWGDDIELQSKLQGYEKALIVFDMLFKKQKKDYEKQAKLTKICTNKQEEYNRCNQNVEAIKSKYRVAKEQVRQNKETLKDVGCRDEILPCKFVDNSRESIETEEDLDKIYISTMKDEDTRLKLLQDGIDSCNKKKQKFKIATVDEKAYDDLKKKIGYLREQIKDINCNQNLINILKTELKNFESDLKDYKYQHKETYKKIDYMYNISQKELDLLAKENSVQYEEIEKLEGEIVDCKVSATEFKKELEFSRNEILKIQKFDKDIKEVTIEVDKLSIISKAFSKDGIPQLMIDAALPQLQDILNQLTSYIMKFYIRISTQQEQKNETLKETISFIVDDGIKKRDIKYFSGGEKKLLKTIVRLSLSLFQSQRSGNSYKLLFMDEAFDALDRDNSILLLRIIYNLKGKFNQIFIISHSTDVLGNLSKCIRFEKDGERTVVK